MSKSAHKSVDYIRNCVEQQLGRRLSDTEYRKAYEASYRKESKHMAGRIFLIAQAARETSSQRRFAR